MSGAARLKELGEWNWATRYVLKSGKLDSEEKVK